MVFAFANCTQHNPTGSSRSPRDDWPGIAEVSAVVYAGPENVPVEGSARNEVLNAAWGRYWFFWMLLVGFLALSSCGIQAACPRDYRGLEVNSNGTDKGRF